MKKLETRKQKLEKAEQSEGSPMRELKERTKDLALRILRLHRALPKSAAADVIGRQLLRSGTSVGANYREGIRARSPIEYAAKLNIALMELEETAYWLELLAEGEVVKSSKLSALRGEVSELTAIFVTLIKKVKNKR